MEELADMDARNAGNLGDNRTGPRQAATNCSFSLRDQRQRRSPDVITSIGCFVIGLSLVFALGLPMFSVTSQGGPHREFTLQLGLQQPVTLFHPNVGGRQKAVGNSEQSGLPTATPTPMDRNGFEAEINGGEISAGGDTALVQDRCCSTETHLGQRSLAAPPADFGLPQHAAPLVEPGVFVPVKVVE